MRTLILICALAVALVAASGAAAADRWAGLTRDEAVTTAKHDLVAYFVAVEGISPAKAATIRRYLDRTPPRKVARVKCYTGRQAWRIVWPKVDPVYVNRRGLVFAC